MEVRNMGVRNMEARNMGARNMEARNMGARNMGARNMEARNMEVTWSGCVNRCIHLCHHPEQVLKETKITVVDTPLVLFPQERLSYVNTLVIQTRLDYHTIS
jgi:hypothetical protein